MADDHGIFRDGFKVLLRGQHEVKLVGEAGDGKQLLNIIASTNPDVVITDIKMPGMDGIELCRSIKSKYPDVQVIALSMFNDDHLIVDMLDAGATGYLLKNTNKAELLNAIRIVYEGGEYYSPDTAHKLARLIGKSKSAMLKRRQVKFSAREVEIIQLICQELTNKEIAAKLKLSVRTVENHRDKIHEKSGAKNSVGLVIYAIRHGIFEV